MSESEYAYTDEEGIYLVKLARKSLETRLKTGTELPVPEDCPPKLKNASGVFVTLRKHGVQVDESLRGCIGMIEARESLVAGVVHMALAAGLEDPRFPPVKASELDHLVFEVTAMTVPKLLAAKNPEEIKKAIKIGRDGLIMQRGMNRGLLLPQVPVEYDWDVETFLSHTCRKAWLPEDAWKQKDTKIFSFMGEIFEEEEPHGKIIRKIITK
ncbi:MAG: TIGR00296 family protein [Candidatus Lokiarchaeota archaeon]|nr:TIGR00296 family protein [Candidatus Lokiarchaeota archaeon]